MDEMTGAARSINAAAASVDALGWLTDDATDDLAELLVPLARLLLATHAGRRFELAADVADHAVTVRHHSLLRVAAELHGVIHEPDEDEDPDPLDAELIEVHEITLTLVQLLGTLGWVTANRYHPGDDLFDRLKEATGQLEELTERLHIISQMYPGPPSPLDPDWEEAFITEDDPFT